MKQIVWLILATALTGRFTFAQTAGSKTSDSSSLELTVHINNNLLLDEALVANVNDYEQHPEHWQGERLVEIARAYVVQKNYHKAAEAYQLVLASFPNNTNAIRGMGNCYLVSKNYDAAIKQYKHGWSLGDKLSLLALADTYSASGRFQDISPLATDLLKYQKLYTENDEQHEALNVLVWYSAKTDPSTGTNIFLKAIDGVTDSFVLEREDTKDLVFYALETFGYQDRVNQLKDEMDNRMIQNEAIFRSGLDKSSHGNYAGAAADFTKVIEADPNRGDAYSELARAQGYLLRFGESITNFTKAIDLGQKTWVVYCGRGISKQAIGDLTGSLDDFKKAIELNPKCGDAYAGLALAQYYAFQWRPALENFRMGVQYGTTFHESEAYIWLIRSRIGEKAEATKELNAHLLSIPTGETNVWSNIIKKYLIGAVGENDLLQKARYIAPNLKKINAQLCQAYFFAGMKHYFDGDKSVAADLLQKAVDTKMSTPEFFNARIQLNLWNWGGS